MRGWTYGAAVAAVVALSALGACSDREAARKVADVASHGGGQADVPASVAAREATDEGRPEGTRLMVERLARLPGEVDIQDARGMNRERVRALRQLPPPRDLRGELEYRRLLAGELMSAGEWREAIQEGEAILARLAELGDVVGPEYRRSILYVLGTTHLRKSIQDHCVVSRRTDACRFPLVESARYRNPDDSRAALGYFREIAEADPDALVPRWLLNVAAMTLGTYPDSVPAALRVPLPFPTGEVSVPGFEDVARGLGLDLLGQAGGVVMDDFDGDEDLDFLISSSGLYDQLRYFVNLGDGTFEDRTEEAGLMGLVGGLQLRHADYDNDGDLDVYVLRGAWDKQGHPNSLLRNNGDGTFEDVTREAGLWAVHPTQAASWADFDNDGHLDLFVGNESEMRADPPRAHPSALYRNLGDGTFRNVSSRVGLDIRGFVKAAVWGDYDNDGLPDLYLSLFDDPNRLYHNDGGWDEGGGGFTDVTEQAGVAEPALSFPAWFWDYDNDGWLDLFVSSFGFAPNTEIADYLDRPFEGDVSRLYHNRGDGTFEDATAQAGLDLILFTMGSEVGDLDNDGYLDFYAGTGMPDQAALFPNRMFRNVDGRRFEDVSAAGFGLFGKGHGVAFGDVDNDGDQDVYAVIGGAIVGDRYRNVLFENPGNANHWITLRLEGVTSNRSAIGARVTVTVEMEDGQIRMVRTVVGGGSSFGGSPLRQEIGLGSAVAIRTVEIEWPTSGTHDVFEGVTMNRFYIAREGDENLRAMTPPSIPIH